MYCRVRSRVVFDTGDAVLSCDWLCLWLLLPSWPIPCALVPLYPTLRVAPFCVSWGGPSCPVLSFPRAGVASRHKQPRLRLETNREELERWAREKKI